METCCHYWLVKPPHGPVSHAICKLCGEERDFANYAIPLTTNQKIELMMMEKAVKNAKG